jgi:hypothetical protein
VRLLVGFHLMMEARGGRFTRFDRQEISRDMSLVKQAVSRFGYAILCKFHSVCGSGTGPLCSRCG